MTATVSQLRQHNTREHNPSVHPLQYNLRSLGRWISVDMSSTCVLFCFAGSGNGGSGSGGSGNGGGSNNNNNNNNNGGWNNGEHPDKSVRVVMWSRQLSWSSTHSGPSFVCVTSLPSDDAQCTHCNLLAFARLVLH